MVKTLKQKSKKENIEQEKKLWAKKVYKSIGTQKKWRERERKRLERIINLDYTPKKKR